MRVACVGAGPGGLYAAILLARRAAEGLLPAVEVTVYERNAHDDTFGFGVVFSDETLGAFAVADPESAADVTAQFVHWGDIDTFFRGRVYTSGGHGFSAMSRVRLLEILQRRAADLGVDLRFRTEAPPIAQLAADHDLVIAADGANSAVRAALAEQLLPTVEPRRCKYMWLGVEHAFGAFTFDIRETEYGVMQAHAYPYDARMSTFIVEMHEETWRRAGFDTGLTLAPGESDTEAIARCAEIFADRLAGHRLVGNNSKWLSFPTVRNGHWRHGNVVLLGDAAHTAHFSIGSGTKLAMEDAIALSVALSEEVAAHDDLAAGIDAALTAYETERRPAVASTQRAAQASLEWFEGLERYVEQDPLQFVFGLLTRSRRITYDNLRLRDPEYVERVNRWFCDEVSRELGRPIDNRPPMFTPFRLGDLELVNRVVVSPMDMYSAADGYVGDFHLAHLGARAMGGAGLVWTEMVCVSSEGRISPGCAGLWSDDQISGWRRITEFVHEHSRARIGLQIGHSGRKGSTKLMWEGIDQPLDSGNWGVVGPSAIPYSERNQVPRELSTSDLDEIEQQFVDATRRGLAAGFDLLEVHLAHGYLLSSFLSPLTNRRDDEYGGSAKARARYPLRIVRAVRDIWPGPLSARISAHDWVDGGFTDDDAVELAGWLAEAGVDLVDVSSGQVDPAERPAYGRSYQTPFADRIRNEVKIATQAVGAISSYDDVNSIILAGRADLCALGRPHLYDPAWTLHAAAEQEYTGEGVWWPPQYRAGSRRPMAGKADLTVRSRLVPLPPGAP